jgi:DNA (cytosine-5)-methyltransferase 1
MSKFDVGDPLSELLIDNFAGGGGTSTGIRQGMGREVDFAINHNAEALDMHAHNHPGTNHLCESVFDVDPLELTKGRPVGLVWLSPDCKHHSKAKGGKPREQGIRGLAWIGLRWLVATKPRKMMLENVCEFKDWGPLDEKGQPIKALAGITFNSFCAALSTGIPADDPAIPEIMAALGADFPIQHLMNGLGCKVEFRTLRACDFGAPTIRKRLFLIASRDDVAITWPEPTHGDPKKAGFASSGLLPWKTAADCIDWNEPTKSIFDRKRPLAVNTMRRIAKGIKKFVLDAPTPFIVSLAHGEVSPGGIKRWGEGVRSIDQPLQTVLANGNGASLVQPFLAKFRGDSAGASLEQPMPTITSGGDAKRPAGSPHALGLVTTGLAPFITEHANSSNQRVFAADEPLRTQCANVKGGHFSLVGATLIESGYGEREGQSPRVPGLDSPLGTVVSGSVKHALVTANITTFYGDKSIDGNARGAQLDEPLRTQTSENRHGLVLASISKFRRESPGTPLDQPLDTVAASGQHHGLIKLHAVHMEQANGGGYAGEGRSIEEPISTVLSTGSHQQLITSELATHGQAVSSRLAQVRAFAKEYLGLDALLVTIHGVIYEITDIGLRMLIPRELFMAQGFPNGYIIEFKRKGKKLSKSAQVRMVGNSVCPVLAKLLVELNMFTPRARTLAAA